MNHPSLDRVHDTLIFRKAGLSRTLFKVEYASSWSTLGDKGGDTDRANKTVRKKGSRVERGGDTDRVKKTV